MATTKQILIRVSDEQYEALVAKAKAAGMSVPALLRESLEKIKLSESVRYAMGEQLLLARIGNQLEIVAEECRKKDDKIAATEIVSKLITLGREIQRRKKRCES